MFAALLRLLRPADAPPDFGDHLVERISVGQEEPIQAEVMLECVRLNRWTSSSLAITISFYNLNDSVRLCMPTIERTSEHGTQLSGKLMTIVNLMMMRCAKSSR